MSKYVFGIPGMSKILQKFGLKCLMSSTMTNYLGESEFDF